MQTKISKSISETNTVYQLSAQDLANVLQAIDKQANNCHSKTLMYYLSTNAITITSKQTTCMQITNQVVI